ncbi:PepSY domain-containing protein [Porphyrobacter sp. AAP82]|uniref:PepSY domain-containing protein n=1 Tax=Porphyrobacter sp. AAP82 TaxID=1248917 RepID=UPI000360ABB3|nr:PepSY domain-containing protein [Porphyrobacter sp. AAP82]
MTLFSMRTLARWHIWLGWLVGVPIAMWLATGLFMTLRPIEDVRGDHLRITTPPAPLALPGSTLAGPGSRLREMRVVMQEGRAVAILTGLEGEVRRVDFTTGAAIPALDAAAARALVAARITGGDKALRVTLFPAGSTPFDFRKALAVWQVALADGTNVYVGQDTGEIEAVRTRWWRAFDLAWGLHIMDLSEREDTSHPVLILFAALSLTGALIGCVLMFRRRKARVTAPPPAGMTPPA